MPLTGIVQVPTVIPTAPSGFQQLLPGAPELPNYQLTTTVSLEDPETGQKTPIATTSQMVKLGNPLTIPVSFNTKGLKQNRYNYWLTVQDAYGNILFDQIIYPRAVFLMAAEGFGVPTPTVPTPTAPTAAMLGTPSLNLPTSVTYGDTWKGNIIIPTTWPAGVPTPPALPSLPLTLLVQLETPDGQRLNVASLVPSFQPGQAINIPVSFDTNQLPGPGTEKIFLTAKDLQGNNLLPGGETGLLIGALNVLAAAVPKVPQVPTAYKFTIGKITASPGTLTGVQQVTVTAPVTNQSAVAVPVTVYFNFREGSVLPGAGTLLATSGGITRTMQPGETYNFQASRTETSSNDRFDVGCEVRVEGKVIASREDDDVYWKQVPTAPKVQPSSIPRVDVSIKPQSVPIGGTLTIPFSYQHQGAAESVTVHAAIGNTGVFGFDEILSMESGINIPQDTNLASRPSSISIPITTKIAPNKTYSVYVKLMRTSTGLGEVISPTVANVITISGAAPSAPALPPKVTVQTPTVTPGQTLRYTYENFLPNSAIYSAMRYIGNVNGTSNSLGSGTLSATVPADMPAGTYSIAVTDSGGHSATAQFTVQAAAAPPTVPTPPAAQPTATASPSTVTPGQTVTISYSGFQPNSAIYSATRTIGNVNGTSNSQGAGTLRLSIPASLPPGTYNTAVTDSYGHSAIAQFTVQTAAAPPAAQPTLSVENSGLKTGENLVFKFSGFQPSASVTVGVEGGGSVNLPADSTGGGYYYFQIGESAGTYTLYAQDSYGHRATTSFRVT